MFKSRVNRVKNLMIKGDLTTFTWEVGRFESVSFGDPIVMSQIIQGGADEWKLTFYPKVCHSSSPQPQPPEDLAV
jgi:hypothetical protein